MNRWLGMCIWGLLSAALCIYMAKRTNQRAVQEYPEDKKVHLSYVWNRRMIAMLWGIVLLSLCGGYAASEKAVSYTAWVELTLSYAAVLSAAVMDYKLNIIPNRIPLFLMVSRGAVLLYELLSDTFVMENLISSVLGFVVCLLVFLTAGKVFPGGIGKGDIKLLAALGFSCGVYTVFSTLLLALFCCVIVSVILMIMKKVTLKDYLPFGPFIWMGYLCMILLAYSQYK